MNNRRLNFGDLVVNLCSLLLKRIAENQMQDELRQSPFKIVSYHFDKLPQKLQSPTSKSGWGRKFGIFQFLN